MPDLQDGESTEMKGSGAKPYVLKNTGGVYSCTCPAWRNQSFAIEKRTCKHLKKLRGEEAEIGTGVEPAFSRDGHWFAAVQLSGAGWGNLEGFGIWEVTPEGVRQRFFNMALPAGEDWRVDGWPREDCVALSAAPISVSGSSEQATERLVISVEIGERIALDNVTTPACGVTDATQGDG